MQKPIIIPEDLFWLKDQISRLMLPAAVFDSDHNAVAPYGATRAWGAPDIPVDNKFDFDARTGSNHPYDDKSFYLQLNMEDIPVAIRKPEWPTVGVVWVFIDLSGEYWKNEVYFDPRAIKDIQWQPRINTFNYWAAKWSTTNTYPCCTENTLPELWPCRAQKESWVAMYDDWAAEVNEFYTMQVGGWIWPIQGDFDKRNEDFVCALTRQEFGDCGAIYLHYSVDNGFYAHVETC